MINTNVLVVAVVLFIIACCLGFLTWQSYWLWKRTRSAPRPDASVKTKPKSPRKIVIPVIIIRTVAIIGIGYAIYYLIWRLTSTMNPGAMWFSWILWAAELYGLLIFILFAFITWELVNPVPPKPRDGLAVDVFVATYGEPVDILRATLVGCGQIRYPHQTYVLDDTGREEVRALAASHGCGYITRTNRKGAKAGAINNALKLCAGEFAVVLDADHVPLPGFIDDTLGFFTDAKVAIVQGPQLFYNLDSFEHSGSPWHEQRIFFHVIQPGKNRTKSAFWAGTPSIIRKSAIQAIGGVAEESITEDLHTSIRLVRGGYHIVYIDRPLAAGLAPATAEDFLGQRFRWAQGAMQIFRLDNPLTAPGFSLSQRLSFFASMETYFDSVQKLILFLVPLIVLTTGLLPMSTYESEFWIRFIPYITLMFLSNWLLGRGTFNIWDVLRYDTVKMFTFIAAIPALVTGKTKPFRVTSKEAGSKNRSPLQRIVAPHWIFMGLTTLSIGVGVAHMIHPFWYDQKILPLVIAAAWGIFDLVLLGSVVQRMTSVSRRVRYRFPVQAKLQWQVAGENIWHDGQSIDLSSTGLGFLNDQSSLQLSDGVNVVIPADNKDDDVELFGTVAGSRLDEAGNQRVGLLIHEFHGEGAADRYSRLVYSPASLLRGEDEAEHNPAQEKGAGRVINEAKAGPSIGPAIITGINAKRRTQE